MVASGAVLCIRNNKHGVELIHLMRGQRSECGAIIGTTDASTISLPAAMDATNQWCYSCLGNALALLERKGAA